MRALFPVLLATFRGLSELKPARKAGGGAIFEQVFCDFVALASNAFDERYGQEFRLLIVKVYPTLDGVFHQVYVIVIKETLARKIIKSYFFTRSSLALIKPSQPPNFFPFPKGDRLW
jgi:hypothetical protein